MCLFADGVSSVRRRVSRFDAGEGKAGTSGKNVVLDGDQRETVEVNERNADGKRALLVVMPAFRQGLNMLDEELFTGHCHRRTTAPCGAETAARRRGWRAGRGS